MGTASALSLRLKAQHHGHVLGRGKEQLSQNIRIGESSTLSNEAEACRGCYESVLRAQP